MMRTAWVVLVLAMGCDGDGPYGAVEHDAPTPSCTPGASCVIDFTCETGGMRCTCSEHAPRFIVCESLACPSEPVAEGMACSDAGIVCDPDFEFAGYRCIAPEYVFVACAPGGTYDSRCPFARPTEGAPCCWTSGLSLDPCTYDDDPGGSWSCTADHWARTTTP